MPADGITVMRSRDRTQRGAGVTTCAAILLIALSCVACGGAGPTKAAGAPLPTPSPPTTASLEHVVVHVPTRHTSTGVVVLHSLAHDVSEPIVQGWNATADRHGFIAIYLSRGPDWNAGLCCGKAAVDGRDDVTWLDVKIVQLKKRYHLSIIYLSGTSNGAMMVERLITEHPSLSDRFATWAGAPEMPWRSSWAGHGFLFSGTADRTVPYDGGTLSIEGRTEKIEPAGRTRRCLPHANLTFIRVPGIGHSAPARWPETAWAALSMEPSRATALQPCI